MLTPEQQAALGGYRPQDKPGYKPAPPVTFRPFPGEMGRPGTIMPSVPVSSSPRSMGMMGDFLLIALLGMLG